MKRKMMKGDTNKMIQKEKEKIQRVEGQTKIRLRKQINRK